MRKNSTDFSTPQRQSIEGIVLNIMKTLNTVFRKILPAFLVFLINKKGRIYVIFGLGLFALISIIISVLNYFKYNFYIEDDKLIVNEGVINKKRLSIPFDRIQAVNFEQNVIHQVLDVVAVKIDTAGSKGSEIEMASLKKEVAMALRDQLLSKKTANSAFAEKEKISRVEEETILKLSFAELIKAGVVENHLKSIGLLIATVMGFYQNISDLFGDDTVDSQIEGLGQSISIFFAVVGFVLVVGFLISLGRMVLKNFDLRFTRIPNGFKIYGGLLKRRHISALDHKIQVLSYQDNPLKKIFGIHDLILKQAASREVTNKKSIHVPAMSMERIDAVKNLLFSGLKFPTGKNGIQKAYLYRMSTFAFIGWAILGGIFFYFKEYVAVGLVCVGLLVHLITIYLVYKKKGYAYNADMLKIYGGSYGDSTSMVPIYKLQSLEISQSPYQRRKDLANLTFYTASGELKIKYITHQEAVEMFDYFMCLIETNKKEWI